MSTRLERKAYSVPSEARLRSAGSTAAASRAEGGRDLQPVLPFFCISVGKLMVEGQHAARLEMVVEAPQGFHSEVTVATEAKGAAKEDCSVRAREVEIVHDLPIEVRCEALAGGFVSTEGKHIG